MLVVRALRENGDRIGRGRGVGEPSVGAVGRGGGDRFGRGRGGGEPSVVGGGRGGSDRFDRGGEGGEESLGGEESVGAGRSSRLASQKLQATSKDTASTSSDSFCSALKYACA